MNHDALMIRVALFIFLLQGALPATQPNVLMIVVDDMNDWIGCLDGHPDVQTPNIDRLAKRGMLFVNAHCAAPVCNASRVATLTGKRPGITGIYDNSVKWHQAIPNLTTIPQHFRANGYHVVGGGKVFHHMPDFNRRSDWHHYLDQVFDGHYQDRLHRGLDVSNFRFPAGFPLNGIASVKAQTKPPKNPKEFDWGPLDKEELDTGDGNLIQWATDYLKQNRDRPFFLAAGIFRPHLPFYAPKKYFDLYPQDTIRLPQIKVNDLDDLPATGLKLASQRREDFELVMKTGKYREMLQAYLASISFADAMVGRLLDALDENGHAEDTLIVLWSDHGWHLGEKQHLHKFTLWERSTRIPFVVVAPGTTRPHSVCEQPVGMLDLFPTLNELCGLPKVDELSGQSLSALLKDPTHPWDHPALTSHGPGNHAVRSKRYRYIRYADGGEELYDHVNDPNEWSNLAMRSEYSEIKTKLAHWLPESDVPPKKRKRN